MDETGAYHTEWIKLERKRQILFAAADAKSLQSCRTLCDPRDGSPPSSPVPGILQARTLEWLAISSSNAWKWKVKVKSLSCVLLLVTPWSAAHQAPPSMGFSRQEYWSGVPLPSPKQCILTHMYGIRKTVTMILQAGQQRRHRCKEQTFGLFGKGKGGMIWDNSSETCILPYVKQMTSASLMPEVGHSELVVQDNPQGWDGEGCGRGVQDGETHVHPWVIHIYIWQKASQYCKVIILQLQ